MKRSQQYYIDRAWHWLDKAMDTFPQRSSSRPLKRAQHFVIEGLTHWPKSGVLWVQDATIQADLSIAGGESARGAYSRDRMRACFRKALNCEPDNSDVHYEIAYWNDVWLNLPTAIHHYRKAIDLGDRKFAVANYARALAQIGERKKALAFLRKHRQNNVIRETASEIRRGIWNPS